MLFRLGDFAAIETEKRKQVEAEMEELKKKFEASVNWSCIVVLHVLEWSPTCVVVL